MDLASGMALLPLLQQMHDFALSHCDLLVRAWDGPASEPHSAAIERR
ncbi:hypothetical protein [Aeromonas salmonicida]